MDGNSSKPARQRIVFDIETTPPKIERKPISFPSPSPPRRQRSPRHQELRSRHHHHVPIIYEKSEESPEKPEERIIIHSSDDDEEEDDSQAVRLESEVSNFSLKTDTRELFEPRMASYDNDRILVNEEKGEAEMELCEIQMSKKLLQLQRFQQMAEDDNEAVTSEMEKFMENSMEKTKKVIQLAELCRQREESMRAEEKKALMSQSQQAKIKFKQLEEHVCQICEEIGHGESHCKEYPHAETRRIAVQLDGKCAICLAKEHKDDTCSKKKCFKCGEDHHPSLCLDMYSVPAQRKIKLLRKKMVEDALRGKKDKRSGGSIEEGLEPEKKRQRTEK